jgi:DNA-binding beta-propeller fold protein YncE
MNSQLSTPTSQTWRNLAAVSAGVAVAAAVAMFWNSGAHAQLPAPARRVPVFEVDSTWPKLPNDWVVGHVASVAVDRRDHVWMLHRPNTIPEDRRSHAAPPVLEFDASGKFVSAWGGPGSGYDWPDSEHGIAVDYKDNVWIGGSAPIAPSLRNLDDDMLLKFDNKGKFLLQIGGRSVSKGNADTKNVHQSADVFVWPQTNEAFVADGYGNRRVVVFDADTGAFKRQWGAFSNAPIDVAPVPRAGGAGGGANAGGGRGATLPLDTDGPGSPQFGGPVHAVKVSNDGLVYVADRPNRRVQVFTPEGRFVTQAFINRSGPSPQSAAGLAFSPDPQQQFLYVADYGNSRIAVLDRKTLQLLYQFGQRSERPGDFQGLHHLAVDSKGNLYTGEVAPGARAQRFAFKGLSQTLPPNAIAATPPLQLRRPGATQGPASVPQQSTTGAAQSTAPRTFPAPGQARGGYPPWSSTMANPYRVIPNWPQLGDIKPGAAIGIVPDGKGGTWLHHRSEPPILHIDASGKVDRRFGNGMFVQAHGFCQDRDGNFWAGDSGPFADNPATKGRGFQLFKFSPDGKVLLSLGKAGVSKAGTDTFIGPTACAIAPNGDIIVADGHWPRPSDAQQDGDRLVRLKTDGTFVAQYGRMGTAPGEFMGPHALAFDSQGRLFVADRSNNRIQIFDRNMQFVDEWRHFGRPSGIAILKDDTLIVADSESSQFIGGPPQAPEGGGSVVRNPGWGNGIRIGSAKDGSLRYYVQGTRPEGMGADNEGNVFAGLTGGCDASPSGGCLQKWVRK